jgi:hypothetical protein
MELSKRFSSAIGYSMVNIENSSGQLDNTYHRGHYALANLLFYPVENVMFGGEFQWGRRENFRDGFASNDYRIQSRSNTRSQKSSVIDLRKQEHACCRPIGDPQEEWICQQ